MPLENLDDLNMTMVRMTILQTCDREVLVSLSGVFNAHDDRVLRLELVSVFGVMQSLPLAVEEGS